MTSAAGLLTSDLRYDVSKSYLRPLGEVDPAALHGAFVREEEALRDQLRSDGRADDEIGIEWGAELRYQGQSYELKIPIGDRRVSAEGVEALRRAFHQAHEQEFSHHFPEFEIELVNLRLTGIGALPHPRHEEVTGTSIAEAHAGDAQVAFRMNGSVERVATPIYDREAMPVNERVEGPAVIVQLDSTTLVPPGSTAERDPIDNLIVTTPRSG